jgi:hypothetical protein
MNKYYQTITNITGDSLANHRVQVADETGSIIIIYADNAETRFTNENGDVVNYTLSSLETGMAEFYFRAELGQTLQVLDSDGVLVRPTITDFSNNYSTPVTQSRINTILGFPAANGNFGSFTGSVFSEGLTLKPLLQEASDAIEALQSAAVAPTKPDEVIKD